MADSGALAMISTSRDAVRYRNLLLLFVGVAVVAVGAELAFRLLGTEYSLTQRSGFGQKVFFAIGFAAILWFSPVVAKVNPIAFLWGYLIDWRRMMGGFAAMFLLAFASMILLHVVLGLFGVVHWNSRAWEALTPKIWERTAFALLIVVLLTTAEELIFRGFVLRYLRARATGGVTVAAVIVSAAIFSALHAPRFILLEYSTIYIPVLAGLFLLGALLGTVYVTTGSLACSIGIHAGLLGFKVFERRTHLAMYEPNWLFGIRSNGMDLRSGPAIWLLLIAAALLFVAFRYRLWPRLWIETAVAAENSAVEGIGFRLETRGAGEFPVRGTSSVSRLTITPKQSAVPEATP
jgi:membrane protease YdiL (CAAX protease family)